MAGSEFTTQDPFNIHVATHKYLSQGSSTDFARLKTKLNAGLTALSQSETAGIKQTNVTAQTPTAATATVLTGSAIAVPAGGLKIGTTFRWSFDITKTAAGNATSTYVVQVGTAGTPADADILTFTKPAGTAAIDTGKIVIEAVVRGPLTSSCIMAGDFNLTHNLASTGHAQIPSVNVTAVSSAFDATVSNLIVSLACTTGASDAITTEVLVAEAWNL